MATPAGRRWWRLGCAALATLPLRATGGADPLPPSDCAPWPGEMEPLPRTSDPDFLRAEWARLRAAEVARLAERLESVDPVEAHRTWLHALCLDPADDALARGAARTITVSVLRAPAPAIAEAPAARRASTLPDVGAPPPRGACEDTPSTCPPAQDADRVLARLESLVREARFDEAVAAAGRARTRLDALGTSPLAAERRARLELLVGTAEVALGHRERALACFERAIAADPGLDLDRARTSPKVIRLFDEARSAARAGDAG